MVQISCNSGSWAQRLSVLLFVVACQLPIERRSKSKSEPRCVSLFVLAFGLLVVPCFMSTAALRQLLMSSLSPRLSCERFSIALGCCNTEPPEPFNFSHFCRQNLCVKHARAVTVTAIHFLPAPPATISVVAENQTHKQRREKRGIVRSSG